MHNFDVSFRAIVRLGDHDLFTNADGVTPMDVPIAEVIKHPEYNPSNFYNDIGRALQDWENFEIYMFEIIQMHCSPAQIAEIRAIQQANPTNLLALHSRVEKPKVRELATFCGWMGLHSIQYVRQGNFFFNVRIRIKM